MIYLLISIASASVDTQLSLDLPPENHSQGSDVIEIHAMESPENQSFCLDRGGTSTTPHPHEESGGGVEVTLPLGGNHCPKPHEIHSVAEAPEDGVMPTLEL